MIHNSFGYRSWPVLIVGRRGSSRAGRQHGTDEGAQNPTPQYRELFDDLSHSEESLSNQIHWRRRRPDRWPAGEGQRRERRAQDKVFSRDKGHPSVSVFSRADRRAPAHS